jgi:uncharacterized membrane protein YsdA (DUF1294 family)
MQAGYFRLAILVFLVLVNVIAYLMMWWDKRKARKKEWRVAEATLLILSFVGGAIGLLIGMFTLRHKTQKGSFKAVAFLGLIVSIIIYYIIFRYFFTLTPVPIT